MIASAGGGFENGREGENNILQPLNFFHQPQLMRKRFI